MARSLAEGQRVINRLFDELEAPEGLASKYAEAVLAVAVQNAASRPTPQAPMAASVLRVSGPHIAPPAGGSPAEVGVGAEFGSNLYPQFHRPSNPRGYWLWPAGEQVADSGAGDRALEAVMDSVIGPF